MLQMFQWIMLQSQHTSFTFTITPLGWGGKTLKLYGCRLNAVQVTEEVSHHFQHRAAAKLLRKSRCGTVRVRNSVCMVRRARRSRYD